MSFQPLGDVVNAITERLAPGKNPPHTAYRPITAAELYSLAGRSWVPAACADALVRAARTIEAASTQPKGVTA